MKTLQAASGIINSEKHCFELYGFDVLLDEKLKPWLIEVNASPSFTGTTPSDKAMKNAVLDDCFTILDPEGILTGKEELVGGFDLICKGSPVKRPTNSTFKSHLGCYNNRQQELKKLAKLTASRLAQQY